HTVLTQAEVGAIAEPIARFFTTKTMTDLYDAALTRGLMLAPANTAKEILASRQYRSRELFVDVDDTDLGRITIPRRFVVSDGVPGATAPAPAFGDRSDTTGSGYVRPGSSASPPRDALSGIR